MSPVLTSSEPQAQFFHRWASYGVTATLTSLTVLPFPALRQYFISGFKLNFTVQLFPGYVKNKKSARLTHGAVELFLARMLLFWRVAGPLASFPFVSPLYIICFGVFQRRSRPGKCSRSWNRRTPMRSTTVPLSLFFTSGRRNRFHHAGGPWDPACQNRLLRRLSSDSRTLP